MDPNTLDPKLKATYEKVMGTQTAPTQPPPLVTNPNTPPAAPAVPPAPAAASPVAQAATPPSSTSPTTPSYTSDNLSFQAAIQTPQAAATPLAPVGQIPQHQTSSLLKVLYIIGSLVFFVVYAFVWIKIFNLPVPFLN